jgi:hypothetical protein
MIGWAQLYECDATYVVAPMARTNAGYLMSVEPAERLRGRDYVDDERLGAALCPRRS